MLRLIKKSLPAVAIYSSFVILNNLYLFSQYKTVSSQNEILQLFSKISSPLAIISLLGFVSYCIVGWLNFKKAENFKQSIILNAYTALGFAVVLCTFDIIMSIFVQNYAIIMTGFAHQQASTAFVQVVFYRILISIPTFGFFTLVSFIFSKILKKK